MRKTIDVLVYEKTQFETAVRFLHKHVKPIDRDDYVKRLDKATQIYTLQRSQTIVGLCFMYKNHHEQRGHTLDFDLKMDPYYLTMDVLTPLFHLIDRFIEENQIDLVATSIFSQCDILRQSLSNHGFTEWFVLKKMIHDGRILPQHNLHYRHYEDKDFDIYFQGLGDAFYPMRKAMDITPYHVCNQVSEKKALKERESFLKEKDSMYLFFEEDTYIGAVSIIDAEIDDFYVVDSYQGKGYGKKIIEFSVNLAKEQSKKPVHLTVVDWNEKAKKLYESVGFRWVETNIYYRRVIQRG